MKKNIFRQITALLMMAAAVVTTGCGDDPTPEPEPTPVTPNFPTKVEKVVKSGETYTLSINPNMDWKVSIPTEAAQYFSLVDAAGQLSMTGKAGQQQIKIKAAEIDEFDNDRTCEVSLTMGGKTQIIAKLTRQKLARTLNIYVAEYDEANVDFKTDAEGAYVYGSTPVKTLDFLWHNEQYMHRIVVETNFKWAIGGELPAWLNPSTTTGEAGRTEIFVRTEQEAYPFAAESVELVINDLANESAPVEAGKLTVNMPACEAFCQVSISPSILFNAEGYFYNASTDEYIEAGAIASMIAPKGAELYKVAKSGEYLYTTSPYCDWIQIEWVDEWDAAADAAGVWNRKFLVNVEATTAEREAMLVALPRTEVAKISDPDLDLFNSEGTALKAEYEKYVVSHIKQEAPAAAEDKGVIYANDIETMHAFTADFAELAAGSWPWQGAWTKIPNAYKLTYRSNDSGDDLIFSKPFSRYEIYGFDGASSSTYDLSTCWITLEKSEEYKGLTNGYKVRMRLGDDPANGLFPNTQAGWDGENEATIVFYDENDEAYALIYCVLDPNYMYVPEVSGEVKFVDPAAAEMYGAKLEKVVEGDPDFSAENNYMGVLQYRLTYTSAMGAQALLLMPSYNQSFCYPSESWLSTQQVEGGTQVMMNPEEDYAKGHITYHAGNDMVVYLYCVFNYTE
ncbi:MAG: hypothetical protein II315_07035 [Rikenellaceae bacterium]|nr:hypothetical protein [Rikenellaceae bacterium]